MTFNIATGQSSTENASTSSQQTPVVAQTVTFASQEPPSTVLSPDLVSPQAERIAGYTADARAAQAAAMAAEIDRRNSYAADIQPLGAQYGDAVTTPQPVAGAGVGISDVPMAAKGMGY